MFIHCIYKNSILLCAIFVKIKKCFKQHILFKYYFSKSKNNCRIIYRKNQFLNFDIIFIDLDYC